MSNARDVRLAGKPRPTQQGNQSFHRAASDSGLSSAFPARPEGVLTADFPAWRICPQVSPASGNFHHVPGTLPRNFPPLWPCGTPGPGSQGGRQTLLPHGKQDVPASQG